MCKRRFAGLISSPHKQVTPSNGPTRDWNNFACTKFLDLLFFHPPNSFFSSQKDHREATNKTTSSRHEQTARASLRRVPSRVHSIPVSQTRQLKPREDQQSFNTAKDHSPSARAYQPRFSQGRYGTRTAIPANSDQLFDLTAAGMDAIRFPLQRWPLTDRTGAVSDLTSACFAPSLPSSSKIDPRVSVGSSHAHRLQSPTSRSYSDAATMTDTNEDIDGLKAATRPVPLSTLLKSCQDAQFPHIASAQSRLFTLPLELIEEVQSHLTCLDGKDKGNLALANRDCRALARSVQFRLTKITACHQYFDDDTDATQVRSGRMDLLKKLADECESENNEVTILSCVRILDVGLAGSLDLHEKDPGQMTAFYSTLTKVLPKLVHLSVISIHLGTSSPIVDGPDPDEDPSSYSAWRDGLAAASADQAQFLVNLRLVDNIKHLTIRGDVPPGMVDLLADVQEPWSLQSLQLNSWVDEPVEQDYVTRAAFYPHLQRLCGTTLKFLAVRSDAEDAASLLNYASKLPELEYLLLTCWESGQVLGSHEPSQSSFPKLKVLSYQEDEISVGVLEALRFYRMPALRHVSVEDFAVSRDTGLPIRQHPGLFSVNLNVWRDEAEIENELLPALAIHSNTLTTLSLRLIGTDTPLDSIVRVVGDNLLALQNLYLCLASPKSSSSITAIQKLGQLTKLKKLCIRRNPAMYGGDDTEYTNYKLLLLRDLLKGFGRLGSSVSPYMAACLSYNEIIASAGLQPQGPVQLAELQDITFQYLTAQFATALLHSVHPELELLMLDGTAARATQLTPEQSLRFFVAKPRHRSWQDWDDPPWAVLLEKVMTVVDYPVETRYFPVHGVENGFFGHSITDKWCDHHFDWSRAQWPEDMEHSA